MPSSPLVTSMRPRPKLIFRTSIRPWKKLGQLRPSNAGKDGKEWLLLEELQGQIARFGTLMTE
uniref:Uncharacterized protein n=1 Tax=Oryza glumipatula TaxID=40148 RepID=A0A0D9Z5V0_9ORYZ